ncbi:hypothetical protein TVAG_156120 [Trichomonas vaginalis G3]|uniref:Ubiquitin-like domain-containing protein n=1 Tax=Trichomonas vaginalis (strain ATCC PRA-98 / G3) TaxID=412133 RepID=A2FPD5_TRIV3|nr:UV excision repair protein RAD23 family [Trichomonas vaginalis G3]EAX93248.1 hypothetical protein TVAG_156120 [Trichomonas vaginalis G3]KAI5516864.1 UV excision repair protein RAD23 family [Trichomonas vaginalis G3]|eukprot:XP_001306178.1 hypothetical protein [Trichomonas vaginalis G3]
MSETQNERKTFTFRVVDLTGLDIPIELEENTSLIQLNKLLQTKYNLDTSRCEFSTNGKLLEDDARLTSEIFKPNKILSMFNNSMYQEKSFPRVDNAFSGIELKFTDCQTNLAQKPKSKGMMFNNIILDRNNITLPGGHTIAFDRPSSLNEMLQNPNFFSRIAELMNNIQNGVPDADGDVDYDSDNYYDNYDDNYPERPGFATLMQPLNQDIDMDGRPEVFEGIPAANFVGPLDMDMGVPPDQGQNMNLNRNLTPQQQEALRRICMQCGVDQFTALQVFEACDYNENMTTNCLMSMTA